MVKAASSRKMKSMISRPCVIFGRCNRNLPKLTEGRLKPADEDTVVLLTGSARMLESHLLDRMLPNAAAKKIICLNRAEHGGGERQAKAIHDRGLISDHGI